LPINGDVSLKKEDEKVAKKVLLNLKRNTNSARDKKRKNTRNKDLIKQDLQDLLGCSPVAPVKKAARKLKDQSPEDLREI
jgi:ArsR family metal-binding transcriptional regulator